MWPQGTKKRFTALNKHTSHRILSEAATSGTSSAAILAGLSDVQQLDADFVEDDHVGGLLEQPKVQFNLRYRMFFSDRLYSKWMYISLRTTTSADYYNKQWLNFNLRYKMLFSGRFSNGMQIS